MSYFSALSKLKAPQLLLFIVIAGIIITVGLPMYLYAINNISSLQKDQEYLAQAVSRAEEDINKLETTVDTMKDTVSEMDKEISIYKTQSHHLIQKNYEGIERLQDTLNQILEFMAKKG